MADVTPQAKTTKPSVFSATPKKGVEGKRGYTLPSKAPMSSSAAKRRSVVALGSIQHLQHYYAKQANAARANAPHPSAKPLPALGRDALVGLIEEDPERIEETFPPTPSPPPAQIVRPYEDITKEEAPSIEEVWTQVEDVCMRWGLVEHIKGLSRVNSPAIPPIMTPSLSADSFASSRSTSPIPPPSPKSPIIEDRGLVLALLTATTNAIRVVQRYVLALPPSDEMDPDRLVDGVHSLALGDSPLTVRHQLQLAVSTAARPRTSSTVNSKPRVSAAAAMQNHALPIQPKPPRDDPLIALRKASLAVLNALNEMEARFRLPLDDEGHSPSIEGASKTQYVAAADLSPIKTPSLFSEGFVGEGYLYRDNVTLDDLRRESDAVTEWVETADRVLTQCSHLDSRVPALPSSTSAKRNWPTTLRYTENPLGLVYIVLGSFLTPTLLVRLASPTAPSGDRMAFLQSLSDGQLLCLAYNAALRASQKPFGFIPSSSIQDCESVTADVGRTFRRFENLRVLKAALRLRYGLTLGDEVRREKAKSAPPLEESAMRGIFDPRTVAEKRIGWDVQLETLVLEWAECVVGEATLEEA